MKRIAIFSPYLEHIGETKVIPVLANGLADAGYKVDLLKAWREEYIESNLHENVTVIDLGTKRFLPFLPDISFISKFAAYRINLACVALAMLPGFVKYLKKENPDVLVARMLTTVAVLAVKKIAKCNTLVVPSMAGVGLRSAFRKMLWPRVYPLADYIVAPTFSVAEDTADLAKMDLYNSRVIPNPVIYPELLEKSREPLSHPWFSDDRRLPVILGVGRLTRQKDFITLIRAHALVLEKMEANLIILGDGEQRAVLEQEVARLKTTKYIQMPGFDSNPYSYMHNCDVFVLSSRWEGPGHVIIEAQAAQAPLVTTDCPAGPSDTVCNGEAGLICRMQDSAGMADCVLTLLQDKPLCEKYVARGNKEIWKYTPENVVAQWGKFIEEITLDRK